MHTLDVRTLILVVGFLYLVMPSFAWIALKDYRTRPVACWCLGGLLMGVGAIMAALAGRSPAPQTYEWILCLFMASHFLRIQALLADQGRAWPWRHWVLIGAVLVLLVNAVGFGLGKAVWAAQLNNSIAAVCYMAVAGLAWQISTSERSRSALWIAIVYTLLSAAFVYRVLALFFAKGVPDIVVNQLASELVALAGLLSAIIGHMGYVGLALERALERELADIAGRVRMQEESQHSADFARMDQQRTMGELSAALAHELNQPLAAILTHAEVVLRSLGKPQAFKNSTASLLHKIAHSTERAQHLLNGLAASQPLPAVAKDVVDLNQTVREVVALLSEQLRGYNISLSLVLAARPAWVEIDAVRASQVVLNLFQNAIDSLALAPVRHLSARIAQEGASLVLRLCDTGAGMSEEAQLRAGEAFFTSKPYGLGMGLFLSRTIAAQFGGSLRLENTPGVGACGATAELHLPCYEAATA